jgi:NAD(P)H-quinone oxidoreductase subunit 2
MDFANLAAQLNAGIILPEGIVIITLLLVLVIDLIAGRSSANGIAYVAIGGLLTAVVVLYYEWDVDQSVAFLGGFNGDALSVAFRGIIALSAAVTILMSIAMCSSRGHP